MAIVNGKSGTFNISTGNPYISGYVKWQETYDDSTYVNTNKTTLRLTAYLHRTNIYTGETWMGSRATQRIAYFGNENVTDNSKASFTIAGNSSSSGGPYTQIYTASKEITHDTNGEKSLSVGFYMTVYGEHSAFEVPKTTKNVTLTTIPQYLSITSIEITNKTETSADVKWSVSHPRSSTYYSFDDGTTWIGSATYGETLASDGKSGSFNIPNLSANTAYNIKVKFRRADNDLWTESGNQSFTTHDYPHITATPDFVIGSPMYMSLYNPLGRTVTATMYGDNGDLIWTGTGWNGTSIGPNNAPNDITNLYKSIPNKRSGTYKIRIQYESYSDRSISGGTYSIVGNEIPTINGLDYYDNASWVVDITKNEKQIVQNKSDLCAVAPAATTNYGAGSITQYVFECNGASRTESQPGSYPLGTVNSTRNVNLTLTVVDSRGLSASKTIEVEMVPHTDPTAVVTLKRLNNYEDTTYLRVDGSIASVNGKNKMTIKYRYKVSGGEYPKAENGEDLYVTIDDNDEKYTVPEPLDKNNVYVFEVIVEDSFGATNHNKEHTLGKGVFPLFIDVEKNSAGINCFPHNERSFEVDGLGSFGSIKCKNLLYTPYTENNKLTIAATRDDNAVEVWYYCYLEAGKNYTFSCETDGFWGFEYGTDTVEAFLLKDNAYTTIVSINSNPKTFTVPSTGSYFLRCDANKSGTTYSFWNFQVEEGSSATKYVQAKQFEYQEQYFLEEHQVGFWFTGKPLYRKIISLNGNQLGTAESTGGMDVNIPHNISNIREIVKMEDVWGFGEQYRKFPTNYYGTAGWDGQYFCTNTHICFELNANVYNSVIADTRFLYIMIYYTKTTD